MINIREKVYSKAFEDGVNYAIQKMFGEPEDNEIYGRAIRLSKPDSERLKNNITEKYHFGKKGAVKRMITADDNGDDDHKIIVKSGRGAAGRTALIGAGAGAALGGAILGKAGIPAGLATGTAIGAGVGIVSGRRVARESMKNRDKKIFERRLKDVYPEQPRKEKEDSDESKEKKD